MSETKNREINPNKLFLYRHSCGSTTAVEAEKSTAPNKAKRPEACPGKCANDTATWQIVGEFVPSTAA